MWENKIRAENMLRVLFQSANSRTETKPQRKGELLCLDPTNTGTGWSPLQAENQTFTSGCKYPCSVQRAALQHSVNKGAQRPSQRLHTTCYQKQNRCHRAAQENGTQSDACKLNLRSHRYFSQHQRQVVPLRVPFPHLKSPGFPSHLCQSIYS